MRETTLGELCREGGGGIQTGPFGSQLHAADYVPEGVPSVMPQNIGDNAISTEDISRITEFDADRLSKYLLAENDIVYSRRGDVEKRALVRSESSGWLCGTGCLRIRFGPDAQCDPRFISYYLGTESSRSWIRLHAVGATMPNLNTGILSAFPIVLPPLAEQQAIAEVLGALDDKIASNRKLAETAEGLLAAEFEALGFDVDVEPDNAARLSEYFDLNPKYPKPSEAVPVYVDMQKLPTSSMSIANWETREAKGGARFMNGDTLIARITPCLQNRKTGYVDFLEDDQVAVGSTEYIVLRAKDGIPRELSFFLAVSPRFRTFAIRHMVGTSGRQRLAASDLAGYPVAEVDINRLDRWGALATPIVRKLGVARDESRTLATIRDALLPQLMSGKLHVRDVERQVEKIL